MNLVTFIGLAASAVGNATPLSDIEKITVTAARHTLPLQQATSQVVVIDEQQIRQSGLTFVTDFLRLQPGFAVSQAGGSGSFSEVRLRGAESNHLLVLIDGVVANDIGQGGLVDFGQLTLDDVVAIEIVKGPQSALWGSGAVAGVISIRTRGGSHNSLRLEAGGQQTYRAALNGSYESGDWQLYGNGAFYHTAGSNISAQGEEADGHQNASINLGGSVQLTPTQTIDMAFRQRIARTDFDGTDFSSGFPADSQQHSDNLQQGSVVNWRIEINSRWTQQLSWQWNNNENNSFFAANPDGQTHSATSRVSWQQEWQYRDTGQLNGALEFTDARFEQQGAVDFFGDPNQRRRNQTKTALVDIHDKFNQNWRWSVSGRVDNNSEFDSAHSYRIGLRGQVSDDVALFISQAQAVKNPTFVERFGYYVSGLYPFVGNPDLQPETSVSREVGVNWSLSPNSEWQVSLYVDRLQDEINGYYFDPDMGATTAVNRQQKSDRQGVETQFSSQWANWHYGLTYSYLDANEVSSDGVIQPELRRPRHTASIHVNRRFVADRVGFSVMASYTGSHTDLFFPPTPPYQQRVELAAYWLVNSTVSVKVNEQTTLTLRAENLLDHDYQDLVGFQTSPRRLLLGVEYKFD